MSGDNTHLTSSVRIRTDHEIEVEDVEEVVTGCTRCYNMSSSVRLVSSVEDVCGL